MCKPSWCGFVLVFALAAAAAEPGDRGAPYAVHRSGGDTFVVGGSVAVRQAVSGDLIVAGGRVDVDAAVAGDAVALGGNVRLAADIGQSVYAAAGQLTINGKVGRNVRVAGGQVELATGSEVAGNFSAAAGQVRL